MTAGSNEVATVVQPAENREGQMNMNTIRNTGHNQERTSSTSCSSRNMILRNLAAGLLVAAITCLGITSCDRTSDSATAMSEFMDRAQQVWSFSGAVLVAKGDTILLREGYGWADPESRRKNTPETKFLIGSITKPFTAIAILQLWQESKLKLSDPISAYLKDYRPDVARMVTIEHLLSHKSGIPDLVRVPGFQNRVEKPITVDELQTYFEDLPLEFEPGQRYTYSSSNYILLGLIIETVTGKSWDDYIEEYVCGPANMLNTGVYYDYGSRSDFAVGYDVTPDGDSSRARVIHPSCGYAAGALSSNVDDLHQLHRALHGSSLLYPEIVDSMLTARTPFYGYGWLVDDLAGHRLTAHGGGTPGFTSMFQRWVHDSLCVIVLSNNTLVPAHTIATGLAAIALGETYEMPGVKKAVTMTAEILPQYTGVYRIDSSDYRLVEMSANGLVARRKDNLPMAILPEKDDKFFFQEDHLSTLSFLRDDDEKINAHVFRQAFIEDTAWLVTGSEADLLLYGGTVIEQDAATINRIVGRYRIDPAGFILTITIVDGEPYAQAFDSPPIKMLAVSDTTFALEGLSARITAVVKPDGAVESLKFTQDNQTMVGVRVE